MFARKSRIVKVSLIWSMSAWPYMYVLKKIVENSYLEFFAMQVNAMERIIAVPVGASLTTQ